MRVIRVGATPNVYNINRHNSNMKSKECYNAQAAITYAEKIKASGRMAWADGKVCYYI